MGKRTVLGVILIFWSLLQPTPAHADPITISSGFISIGFQARGVYRSAIFDVAGEGFSVNGGNGDVNTGYLSACNQFALCAAGQTVNNSAPFFFSIAFGSAAIDGTAHPLTRSGFHGSFTSGSVTLPDNPADRFTLSAPFSLAGVFDIWSLDQDPVTKNTVQTNLGLFDVAGQGTAEFVGSRFRDGWEFSNVRLNFETAASPTPEPGSLLLLGTGAVLTWRRLRRSRTSGLDGGVNA